MNVTVIGPRVFVRPDNLPETSESGLHLIHDRSKSTMTGTVVAVGDGPEFVKRAFVAGYRAGTDSEPEGNLNYTPEYEHVVRVGERVIFSPDKGEELFFEKDLLISLLEDDILAVIDTQE